MRHKSSTENKVIDALSHRSHILTTISISILGYEEIHREYLDDHDFGCIYKDLLNGEFSEHSKFTVHDGYLYHGNQLCLPTTSIRKYVLRELHGGGCSGHLGCDKTLAIVEDRFFWPCLKTNVAKICELCRVCQLAKGQNTGLYQPIPIPHVPLQYLSMDYLGPTKKQHGR